MTWHYYTANLAGEQAGVLLDDGFASMPPSASFPELGWFAVYGRLDPGKAYWHPDETEELDAIESDLLRLAGLAGGNSAVYVRRVATRGIREYYIYFGAPAELDAVLPRLQLLHPGYRLEYDRRSDPNWAQYRSWLLEKTGA
jgi:hypothetical protein